MSPKVDCKIVGTKALSGCQGNKPRRTNTLNVLGTQCTATATMLCMLLLFHAVAFGHPFSLTWNDPNGDVDGTIVYRSVGDEYQEVGIVGPRVTNFTDDPPASPGDRFCWTLRAFREGLVSEPSNEACATVPSTSQGNQTSSPPKPGKRRG